MRPCGEWESASWEQCSNGLADRVVKLWSKRRARAEALKVCIISYWLFAKIGD